MVSYLEQGLEVFLPNCTNKWDLYTYYMNFLDLVLLSNIWQIWNGASGVWICVTQASMEFILL
jgi:hypothetical protein